MIMIPYFRFPVHSQYLQYLVLFLMEHPILKNLHMRSIIKIQKRSESNVLTNLPNPQKAEVMQMMEPDKF